MLISTVFTDIFHVSRFLSRRWRHSPQPWHVNNGVTYNCLLGNERTIDPYFVSTFSVYFEFINILLRNSAAAVSYFVHLSRLPIKYCNNYCWRRINSFLFILLVVHCLCTLLFRYFISTYYSTRCWNLSLYQWRCALEILETLTRASYAAHYIEGSAVALKPQGTEGPWSGPGSRAVRRRAAAADILLTPPPPLTECRRRAGAVFVTCSRYVVHQLYVARFL